MKKLTLILLTLVMIVALAACGNKCDHAYDNACDATCNECGETREVGAHDFTDADCDTPKTCKICGATDGTALGHTWKDADCLTAKTCTVCGATEGSALGHTPAEDDGDCTTEVKCTVCGEVTTAAKTEHIAHADDGDCTTPVTCTECTTVLTAAKEHNFEGAEWQSNETQHWHVCKNTDCTVTDTKVNHTPNQDEATITAPKKCTVCEHIIEPQLPHEHSYTAADYDDTHHYMRCACGQIDESTKVSHTATSDNDCTTDDKCTCGYTVTAARDHVAGADDGNCETPIKCVNCDKDAKAGATGHHDADHDYLCDNAGCQVTVGNPPKDESDGIDLPIDTN